MANNQTIILSYHLICYVIGIFVYQRHGRITMSIYLIDKWNQSAL